MLWLLLLVLGGILAFAAQDVTSSPFDLWASRTFHEPQPLSAWLMPLMRAVSAPGYTPWQEGLLVLAVLVPLARGGWRTATFLALTATGNLMVFILKLVVARPRPEPIEIYQQVTGYSYPSGHVVNYVVFFGALGFVTWRTLRSTNRPGPLRFSLTGLLALCGVLILLVGASRVYLGAHWATDVLGGYILGGAWLFALISTARYLRLV